MQKKLVAVAVASLAASAAFADTNVSFYGVADAYAFRAKGTANPTGDVRQSGLNGGGLSNNRLGFTGTEDLGSGLKAVFRFEFGSINIDSGNANNNGLDNTRQAYVGLGGPFGTLIGGRLQTIGYDFSVKYDTMPAYVFSPLAQLTDNAGLSVSSRDAAARQNNTVGYVSPSLAGVTVKASYSFGEQVKGAAFDKPENMLGLGVDYELGPFAVGAVIHDRNHVGGLGSAPGAINTDITEWGLGATYDLGLAKLAASYQRAKNKTTGVGDLKEYVWDLGVSVPIGGSGAVKAAYARFKQKDGGDDRVRAYGLDFEQYLSKRTTAYVGYSNLKNNNGAAFSFLNTSATTGADGKATMWGAGMRHTF